MHSYIKTKSLVDTTGLGGPGGPPYCAKPYDLQGPQVDPEASYTLHCLKLRMVHEAELPAGLATPFKTTEKELKVELEELIQMARLRDEPGAIPHTEAPAMGPFEDPQKNREPLSLFLQLRPQPLTAVINTARDQAFPVINTGRELARYFESETPGLSFQLALNYMLHESGGSPPRQAAIWAGLNITIASALGAAWYYKWRGPSGVRYRLRPAECDHSLDVLFDRTANSTNSSDAERRAYPAGVKPMPAKPGELVSPEAQVNDLVPIQGSGGNLAWTGYDTPGTPRHPAYPSGHSTYSAAAAFYLSRFFRNWEVELEKMADNIGMARLWAGVHWRSDHTFGQEVGKVVAKLVIRQMVASKMFIEKDGYIEPPPAQPQDEQPPAQGSIVSPC